MNTEKIQFWIVFCAFSGAVLSPGLVVSVEEHIHLGGIVELCLNAGYNTCSSGIVAVFRTVDIQSCIINCKLRKMCGFINYHFRSSVCFLIREKQESETVSTVTTPGFAFGVKSNWTMTSYANCYNCSEGEVCVKETGLCRVEECPPPLIDQDYSYSVGNVYSVGKKILFLCEKSHMIATNSSSNIAECRSSGAWSPLNYTCQEIDECESNPCQNGGQCNDELSAYSCTCVAGWTGINCETEINECDSSPCLNGGVCNDLINEYSCTCAAGWAGNNCQTNINECDSNPCLNGGQCNDMVNGYLCTCAGGWAGSHCETDINECDSNPCLNGGVCNDLINGYSCTCVSGWTGDFCETDINECNSSPCLNGGQCNDMVNGYSCTCAAELTGTNCETDIDECLSGPCLNGGLCSNYFNGYSCSCIGGWTGKNCQTDSNECSSNPCLNGGTCNDLVNGYSCSCAGGWTGNRCQTDVNECASSPCQNGQCNNLIDEYSCTCTEGWTGRNCQTDTNECASGPCLNGGVCNDLINEYSCTCTGEWTGNRCQTALCTSGWSYFQSSCYRLESTNRKYSNAKSECEGMGGHLADVTSQAEMDFLESLYLQSHSRSAVDGVWLSATDSATEDNWVLSDGTSLSYFNWASGQPDQQLSEDDCLQVWPNTQFKWNDVYCGYGYWFYCEK